MAPPSPLPAYIYKIVPEAPPSPIPAEYPPSELDQQDGFIHLSTAKQIPITAGLFFTDANKIWVIKITLKPAFHPITTWEIAGCAHLYGNFGAEDVVDVKAFTRAEGESWEEAMGRQEGFLV